MRLLPLAGFSVLLFAGCQSVPVVFTPLPREAFVGYQRAGDTLRVARLLETGGATSCTGPCW